MWWLWSEICVALQFIWESQPRIESYYVVDGHHKRRLAVPYYSRTLTKNKQSVQPLFLSLISDHPSNSAVTLSGWLFCLSSAIAAILSGSARNSWWWWTAVWLIRLQTKSKYHEEQRWCIFSNINHYSNWMQHLADWSQKILRIEGAADRGIWSCWDCLRTNARNESSSQMWTYLPMANFGVS